MEVKNVSQGGQTNLDFNNSVDEQQNTQNVQNVQNVQIDSSTSVDKNVDSSKISEKDVKKAVEKFNKLMEDKSTHAEYEVYGKFRDITVSIIDDSTNKVIKEIPSKKIIDMIDKFCELAGVFLDQKA
jgi:flagellar protein FlaG